MLLSGFYEEVLFDYACAFAEYPFFLRLVVDVGLFENGGHCRMESPSPLPPLALKAPSLSPVLEEKQNVPSGKTFPVSRFFSSTPKTTPKQLHLDR